MTLTEEEIAALQQLAASRPPSSAAAEEAAPEYSGADALELMRLSGLAGAPDTSGPSPGFRGEPIGDTTGIAAVTDPVMAYLQGATYGTSDELFDMAVGAMFPNRSDPGVVADDVSGRIDDYRDQNPLAAYGLEITGALSNPLSRLGPWSGGTKTQMAQGAGVGGLLSQLYGMGAAEGSLSERAHQAAPVGLLGMGLGAAAPAVGNIIGRGVDAARGSLAARRAAREAPSMDQIRAAADDLYRQADQAAPMSRSDFLPQAIGTVEEAATMGADPMLTPQSVRVLENLAESGLDAVRPGGSPGIGLSELNILRRQAGIPAGNVTDRVEQSVGAMIQKSIDDFVENADPSVSGVLREARTLWGRLRRSEVVENAIERAGRGASGFENGIRIEFRRILNSPRLSRGFTAAERDAMEQVIRGTPVGNALRLFGKFGLDFRQNTNALGASIGVAAGSLAGGAVGAVGLPIAASLARRGAEKTTEQAARRLQTLIATGNLPTVQPSGGTIRGILSPVAETYGRVMGADRNTR